LLCYFESQLLQADRVQTDPGKPGKPGTVNFEKNQGNPGKIFFSAARLRLKLIGIL